MRHDRKFTGDADRGLLGFTRGEWRGFLKRGVDGGNDTWTISVEGNAGYGRAAFLSSIASNAVSTVKLGSYLFLRIPKIWLRRYEVVQKTEKKFYEVFFYQTS